MVEASRDRLVEDGVSSDDGAVSSAKALYRAHPPLSASNPTGAMNWMNFKMTCNPTLRNLRL